MTAHHFTVDLEEYFQVSAFESRVPRSDWTGFESRVAGQVTLLLDLLARHEARATFFVLGWVAERQGDLIRRIARVGSCARNRANAAPVPRLDPADEGSSGGDHRRAGARVPRAEFFDRAGPGVGARRSDRRRLSLRLQPVSGAAPGVRLSERVAPPALGLPAGGAARGDSPDHAALVWAAPARGRGGVLPAAPVRRRRHRVPPVRAPRRAGHLLHPSVGARPRSTAA